MLYLNVRCHLLLLAAVVYTFSRLLRLITDAVT